MKLEQVQSVLTGQKYAQLTVVTNGVTITKLFKELDENETIGEVKQVEKPEYHFEVE